MYRLSLALRKASRRTAGRNPLGYCGCYARDRECSYQDVINEVKVKGEAEGKGTRETRVEKEIQDATCEQQEH